MVLYFNFLIVVVIASMGVGAEIPNAYELAVLLPFASVP